MKIIQLIYKSMPVAEWKAKPVDKIRFFVSRKSDCSSQAKNKSDSEQQPKCLLAKHLNVNINCGM